MNTHGFCAGTLVHTDKGLVPIEQIKVGDMVLSRPEDGDENTPTEYKRVTRTFKSPEKEKIYRMRVTFHGDNAEVYTLDRMQATQKPDPAIFKSSTYHLSSAHELYFYCNSSHPFWTKEFGWKPALDILNDVDYDLEYSEREDHSAITFDGYIGNLWGGNKPLESDYMANVATTSYGYCDGMEVVDFNSGKPVHIAARNTTCDAHWSEDIHFIPAERYYEYLEQQYYQDKPDSDESLTQEYYYTANVYNIEVEDYHTYFVGKSGIWIHQ